MGGTGRLPILTCAIKPYLIIKPTIQTSIRFNNFITFQKQSLLLVKNGKSRLYQNRNYVTCLPSVVVNTHPIWHSSIHSLESLTKCSSQQISEAEDSQQQQQQQQESIQNSQRKQNECLLTSSTRHDSVETSSLPNGDSSLPNESPSSSNKADSNNDPLFVVIDLDETLFFSHLNSQQHHDFSVSIENQDIFVSLRPGAKEFLEWCSKTFEIGLFTAGTETYANALMKMIDPDEVYISKSNYRYRQSCWPVHYEFRINDKCIIQTLYTKDLNSFKRNLSKIVLIDNSLFSFILQPDNGIPISDWRGVEEKSDDTASSPQDENKSEVDVQHQEIVVKEELKMTENLVSPSLPFGNGHQENQQNNNEEREKFKDFYTIKKTLEDLKDVDDVKPFLRSKYKIVDQIIKRCISGMITSSQS